MQKMLHVVMPLNVARNLSECLWKFSSTKEIFFELSATEVPDFDPILFGVENALEDLKNEVCHVSFELEIFRPEPYCWSIVSIHDPERILKTEALEAEAEIAKIREKQAKNPYFFGK